MATLVLVAVGYYAGSLLGFQLKFPSSTPSILWPPNAILTATLLLTAPRLWWLYLLAALPAHLVVQLPAWPPSLVLSLFATNCSEALLAAALIRRFSDEPTRFNTLRRMAAFVVCGGVAAPFLSSFADAAVVTGLRGEAYWSVWRTRFFANVLTELTIVPTIVMMATAGINPLPRVGLRRLPEAAGLVFGLLIIAVLAFGGAPSGAAGIWQAPGTPLALLLPFLLWSAVRFGPGGVSACLLTTTALAIGTATPRHAVFDTPNPADAVMALQLFLSVMAIPLMCLAGVMEERRGANAALEERLRFEELLSRLSTDFVHLPSAEMDRGFERWLARVGGHLGLEGVVLLDFSGATDRFSARWWTAPGGGEGGRVFAVDDFPLAITTLRSEQPLVFADPGELPAAATQERALLRQYGIRAGVVLPLETGGSVIGGLAAVAFAAGRGWDEHLVGQLRLVGEVFANALARRDREDALRTSEGMKSAILSALTSGVAVLDRDGTIIAVNESWMKRASEADPNSESRAGVGDNYLAVWRQAAAAHAHARDAVAGIEGVLAARRGTFALEYVCPNSAAPRWFAVSVVPLNRAEGGAVISHTEITEWKRAELNAQRSREELAHFTRVSTMGALAASLAHELNQPLAGILSNAQAARRFLTAAPPDLDEIDAILTDIVEDDKRAGEVIERLRELLRKGDFETIRLDLNALVRDVAKLLASDALIRGVRIQLMPAEQPLVVTGDRIQLQQVLLNLVVNAMEAVAERPQEERVVVVETAKAENGAFRVAVRDSGPGLDPSKYEKVFEPFYTTKSTGMGMGLSISRSIVEAHGGRIWAMNNRTRGVTVSFTVPVAPENAT